MTKRARVGAAAFAAVLSAVSVAATTGPASAGASAGQDGREGLIPGNLLVSESYYSNDPGIVAGQTQLPPGCTAGNCVTAIAGGSYPQVFNNALADGSFGVTSRIFLAEMTPWGLPLGTIEVPPSELVTSFSSKSELALNLSPDGRTVTFIGYATKPDNVDVSNSNTPGAWTSASLTPSAATRPGSTPRPACLGRPRPTGCATSPAGSTGTAR